MARRAAACVAYRRCLAWSTGAAGVVLLTAAVWAQAPVVRHRIEQYVATNQRQIVVELVDLLSIPNIASDVECIRRNAVHLRNTLARRGFKAELLKTAGNPLVYGRLDVPGAARTLLIYTHYDGQPVDPKFWKQASPFTPVLRAGRMEDGAEDLGAVKTQLTFGDDWRIYGRSASDDKAPVIALCAALDALKAAGLSPTSNLRVIIDGEEESGSPSLVPVIASYRDKLTADLMLIFDGPVHPSMRPTIVFGARRPRDRDSLSTVHNSACTAAITATGFPIRVLAWRGC